jgi:hypothetical protein
LSESIASSFGTAVISLDFAPAFAGAGSGGDLRQHHALLAPPGADHVQRRLAAGAIERTPENLAIDGNNPLTGLGKRRHEALKAGAELIRIETAEQAAEGVVAGRAVRQIEELAQEKFLGLGEQGHVHRALAAAQNRAQRDDQQSVEIMQRGVPAARVVKLLKAFNEPVQRRLPAHVSHASGRIDRARAGQAFMSRSSDFEMRFAWSVPAAILNPRLAVFSGG